MLWFVHVQDFAAPREIVWLNGAPGSGKVGCRMQLQALLAQTVFKKRHAAAVQLPICAGPTGWLQQKLQVQQHWQLYVKSVQRLVWKLYD